MTPTICSGKKRQSRSDMRHNVRRTHLNLALSDILNYGCQRSENSRISGSTHIGSRNNEQNYRQLLVDISDNAVTSSSIDLDGSQSEATSPIESKLESRYSTNDSSYHTNCKMGSASLGEQRSKSQYSSENEDEYDDDMHFDRFEHVVADEEDQTSNSNMAKDESDCETDSTTSLNTEKSAKLKGDSNNPMRDDKDKLLTKHHNRKSLSNVRNTEGLLSIAIKTIKLVKRNQLLQQRLTQLQLETSEFIQSVLANPENSRFRANIQQKVREVEHV